MRQGAVALHQQAGAIGERGVGPDELGMKQVEAADVKRGRHRHAGAALGQAVDEVDRRLPVVQAGVDVRSRDVDEALGTRHLRGADDEAHRERGTRPVAAAEELAVARAQRQVQPRASSASMRPIFSTRATWRPPSKSASRKALTQARATSVPTIRAPEREDVGVVVLAPQARGDRVGGLDAANAADLVRDDRLAGAAATEHDAQLEVPLRHGPRDRRDQVGVVDWLATEGTEVAIFDPQLVEQRAELALELEPRVVGADRDAHAAECTRCRWPFSPRAAPSTRRAARAT